LEPEFAVEDGVGEAELAVLLRVVAAEGDGGDEGGQPVAGFCDFAGDLQLARADGAGVFAGAVDQQLVGDRIGLRAAAAGGQECVAVAVAAGAVDVERGAGVDPDGEAVAVVEPRDQGGCFLPSTRTLNSRPSVLQAMRTSAIERSRLSEPASSSARLSRRYDSFKSTPAGFQIGSWRATGTAKRNRKRGAIKVLGSVVIGCRLFFDRINRIYRIKFEFNFKTITFLYLSC
jgi:hypothetical protein